MNSHPATPVAASADDPHLAAAIARAERRLAMLEELAQRGMDIARELSDRAVSAEGPTHATVTRFAAVSRGVRLTLTLAGRVEEEHLALRNGVWPDSSGADFAFPGRNAEPEDFVADETARLRKDCVREEVLSALEQTGVERETGDGLVIRLDERLYERDSFGHLLKGPFRDAVAAICQDFGLTPDWNTWSDERGFERDPKAWRFEPKTGWVERDEEDGPAAADEPRRILPPREDDGGGGPPRGVEGAATSRTPEWPQPPPPLRGPPSPFHGGGSKPPPPPGAPPQNAGGSPPTLQARHRRQPP